MQKHQPLLMGLEYDIVKTFLDELRKDGRLTEPSIEQLEKMLTLHSLTKKNLLELIKTNASLQNKKS